MEERLVARENLGSDGSESRLRPARLSEYVGQERVRQKLAIAIEAARSRGEALDHVLLSGPPGLGKTTLAQIVAHELGSQLHSVSGPVVEKKGDLAAILANLQTGDVLFIDEIHRLPRAIEEVLYSAMEDFKLDLIFGEGPSARTLQIDVKRFTLVGATTRPGLLSNPLRARFGLQLRIDFYPADELQRIVTRSAGLLGVRGDAEAHAEIAQRSRGTPRVANRLLRRVRDYAQVRGGRALTREIAREALSFHDVDEKGLDALDRKLLLTIIEKFEGGPVGIDTLASALGEERDSLEEVCEPFLIQEGLLQRTPRGRVATARAHVHFGIPIVKDPQQPLGLAPDQTP